MSKPIFSYGLPQDKNASVFTIEKLKQTVYPSNGALAIIACLSIEENGSIDHEDLSISTNFDHDTNGHASSHLQKNEFIAKNYSECEKAYNALVKAAWIEETGEVHQSGFVTCPVCRLTEKGKQNLVS